MKDAIPRIFVCPSCGNRERYLSDEWMLECSRCLWINPDYIQEEEEDDDEVEPTG